MKLSHFETRIHYRNKIFKEESFFADHTWWNKSFNVEFNDYRYKLNKEEVYKIYLKEWQDKRNRKNNDLEYAIRINKEDGKWKDVKKFNDLTNKPISFNAFADIDTKTIESVFKYLQSLEIIKELPYLGVTHRYAYDKLLELGIIKEKKRKNKLKEENEKLKKELKQLKKELENLGV